MKKTIKVIIFLLAGLAVGVTFAKLNFPGYKHSVVMIKKGVESKPIYINGDGRRQVLALSIKNLQKSKDIEIRMEGAEVQSWFPPVFKIPFSHWISVEGGKFKDLEYGKRLPVYVAFNDNGQDKRIEILDTTDGSLIQSIDVLRGKCNGKDHH